MLCCRRHALACLYKANGILVENPAGQIEFEYFFMRTHSNALYRSWLKTPMHIFLAGLFGCTVVVVTSQEGVWVAHLWEDPSFVQGDALFNTDVINEITNGETDRMPSPFPLAQAGSILSSGTNVRIFISTPPDRESNKRALLYPDSIEQIQSVLTGQALLSAEFPSPVGVM